MQIDRLRLLVGGMISGACFAALIFAMTGAGDSSVVAAWVQAAGSILAIGGAVYAVEHQQMLQRKAEEDDRALQGQGLAAALFPELLELQVRIAALRTYLRKTMESDAGGLLSAFSDVELEESEVLAKSWKRTHLLGRPAGASVAQLAAVVRQYNRMAQTARLKLANVGPASAARHPFEPLQGYLEAASHLASSAIEEIRPIHDLRIE